MYNNPFSYGMSIPSAGASTGIKRGLFGLSKINWGNLLSNTQKTLGIINQTIPIIYQIKPIVSNARTMFKIASSLKNTTNDTTSNTNTINKSVETTKTNNSPVLENDDKPVFFI